MVTEIDDDNCDLVVQLDNCDNCNANCDLVVQLDNCDNCNANCDLIVPLVKRLLATWVAGMA